jgi:hypothetical protein
MQKFRVNDNGARKLLYLGSLLGVLGGAAYGQATDALQPQSVIVQQAADSAAPVYKQPSGPRLLNVSVTSTYYSAGLPEGSAIPGATLDSDVAIGGSAALGYGWSTSRTSFSITYTGSYSGRVRYSSWSTMSHALSAQFRHNITPRLAFDTSATGNLINLDQFAFTPSPLASLTSAPASFDELATAVTRGSAANPILNSLLSTATPVNVPAGLLLYATRTLTTSVRAGMTYQRSPRSAWYVNALGTRAQIASQGTASASPTSLVSTPFLPQTTSVGADVGMSYSLSPQTQIRGDFTLIRTLSAYDNLSTNAASLSVSRTIGRSWFFSVQGGTGFNSSDRNVASRSTGPQYLAGSTIGFTTHNHTFTAAYSRTLGSSFTYGAFSSQVTQAAWQWSRPGHSWSLSASFQRQTFDGGLFSGAEGWQALANFTQRLNRGLVSQLGYAYVHYSTTTGTPTAMPTPFSTFDQSMVRATFSWSGRSL